MLCSFPLSFAVSVSCAECSYFPFQLSYWLDTKHKPGPRSSGQHVNSGQDTDQDSSSEDDDSSPLLARANVRDPSTGMYCAA